MKITIYKNLESISKEYDLTNCSIKELETNLIEQCNELGLNPTYAVVTLPEYKSKDNRYNEVIVDGKPEYLVKQYTKHSMTMNDVATEILRLQAKETA